MQRRPREIYIVEGARKRNKNDCLNMENYTLTMI